MNNILVEAVRFVKFVGKRWDSRCCRRSGAREEEEEEEEEGVVQHGVYDSPWCSCLYLLGRAKSVLPLGKIQHQSKFKTKIELAVQMIQVEFNFHHDKHQCCF